MECLQQSDAKPDFHFAYLSLALRSKGGMTLSNPRALSVVKVHPLWVERGKVYLHHQNNIVLKKLALNHLHGGNTISFMPFFGALARRWEIMEHTAPSKLGQTYNQHFIFSVSELDEPL